MDKRAREKKKTELSSPTEKIRSEEKKAIRKKKTGVILAIILIYLVVVAAAAIIIDDRHIEIKLNGPEVDLAEVGQPYTDPGAEAFLTGNLFGRGPTALEVKTDSDVDVDVIGDYAVVYSTEILGKRAEIRRSVHVRDTTPPVITLEHEEGYLASWLVGYKEEGFSAYDSHDGDLTDRVVRTEADDTVYYTVTDSSGNETAVERKIEYGISEPMIRLEGGEELEVGAAFSFTDPGYDSDNAKQHYQHKSQSQ